MVTSRAAETGTTAEAGKAARGRREPPHPDPAAECPIEELRKWFSAHPGRRYQDAAKRCDIRPDVFSRLIAGSTQAGKGAIAQMALHLGLDNRRLAEQFRARRAEFLGKKADKGLNDDY